MRIAVLVHNTISQDTRVLKQLRTLVANGYDVTAFGMAQNKPLGPVRYPGLDVDVYLGFWKEMPRPKRNPARRTALGNPNTRIARHRAKTKKINRFHRLIFYAAIFFFGLALGEPA